VVEISTVEVHVWLDTLNTREKAARVRRCNADVFPTALPHELPGG
jgi:hypothetical protein